MRRNDAAVMSGKLLSCSAEWRRVSLWCLTFAMVTSTCGIKGLDLQHSYGLPGCQVAPDMGYWQLEQSQGILNNFARPFFTNTL